jgi:hydroxypyruvate isomerase
MNRRTFLHTAAAALAAGGIGLNGQEQTPAPGRKGRLRQGVTRGVFGRGVALEDCCRQAASLGIEGFDLVTPADWPRRESCRDRSHDAAHDRSGRCRRRA